jgi:rubredoxin
MNKLKCSNCGFEATDRDFDSVGMDRMCPSCGSLDVTEVDDGA